MAVFLTKKQKSLMKERRKKKRAAKKEKKDKNEDLTSKKEQQEDIALSQPRRIVVPSDLTGKEARKFRKVERRKARKEGLDDSMIKFVTEGHDDEKDDETSDRPKKRQKRSFPSINQLLQQQKDQAKKEEEEKERQKAEDDLPEEYKSQYLALDCEMVGIGRDGKQSALARVSIVDWNGDTVLDTFVKVPSRVSDFRTFVSGVLPKHIQSDKAMDPAECRELVASHLKNKVLVGHALSNDFKALMLQHPKQDIRDTAKYRPFQRLSGTKWRPRKLRELAKQFLDLTIQAEGESHDSVDDANATMRLFKHVRVDWEKELQAEEKKKSRRK